MQNFLGIFASQVTLEGDILVVRYAGRPLRVPVKDILDKNGSASWTKALSLLTAVNPAEKEKNTALAKLMSQRVTAVKKPVGKVAEGAVKIADAGLNFMEATVPGLGVAFNILRAAGTHLGGRWQERLQIMAVKMEDIGTLLGAVQSQLSAMGLCVSMIDVNKAFTDVKDVLSRNIKPPSGERGSNWLSAMKLNLKYMVTSASNVVVVAGDPDAFVKELERAVGALSFAFTTTMAEVSVMLLSNNLPSVTPDLRAWLDVTLSRCKTIEVTTERRSKQRSPA